MQIEYAPRRLLSDRLRAGLVPGHEYNPGDYAIVLVLQDEPSPVTERWIRIVSSRFATKGRGQSNKSTAASSRNHARHHHKEIS